jgi:hypothetical protein
MTTDNRRGCTSLRRLFRCLEDEAEDLAERLEFGDKESVLAWFHYHYPNAVVRVVDEQRWDSFVALIRVFYESGRHV